MANRARRLGAHDGIYRGQGGMADGFKSAIDAGAREGWFNAPHRSKDITSIRMIMKDGQIFKNTL